MTTVPFLPTASLAPRAGAPIEGARPATAPVLPAATIRVGEFEYFTIDQIAAAIPVSPRYLKGLVRAGKLNGRKIGKAYLISAAQFHEYVLAGRFEYKSRPSRRKVPLSDEVVAAAARERRAGR
jgi:excisionase family DNA binding protein